MKKILFLILLISSIAVSGQITQLRLVSDVWPPFTDNEEKKALAIDLVDEALSRMNIETKTTITGFAQVITGIDSKEFDGSAALWWSADRESKYLYSKPYLQNQLILVGKKGADVSAASFKELTGKRIGIVKDYAYGSEISNSKTIVFVKGQSDQFNLESLLSGKIDYMLVDALLIQYLLKYEVNDVTNILAIADKPLLVNSLHFAIRKDIPDGKSIIRRFNDEIEKMVADGSYNRILELNWIQADVNGDGKLELILQGDTAGIQAPTDAYSIQADTTSNNIDPDKHFYINGKLYENWDDIPDRYKIQNSQGNMGKVQREEPQGFGLKLPL